MIDQKYDIFGKKESDIKDITFLIQNYKESVERLAPLINAKASYLQKHPDNERVRQELEALSKFFDELNNAFDLLVSRYNEIATAHLMLLKEYRASREALKNAPFETRFKEVCTLYKIVNNQPIVDYKKS